VYSVWAKETFWPEFSSAAWMWLCLTCVCDTVTCATSVVAFQSDTSSFLSLLAYASVVYAFLVDRLLFHQSMNGVQLTCVLVIFAVTVGVALYRFN